MFQKKCLFSCLRLKSLKITIILAMLYQTSSSRYKILGLVSLLGPKLYLFSIIPMIVWFCILLKYADDIICKDNKFKFANQRDRTHFFPTNYIFCQDLNILHNWLPHKISFKSCENIDTLTRWCRPFKKLDDQVSLFMALPFYFIKVSVSVFMTYTSSN